MPGRRVFLASLAAGAAGAMIPWSRIPARVPGPRSEIADLAARMRAIPRDACFDLTAEAIRSGTDLASYLGAVFLAGVHDVKPRHVGGKLHAVMVVESMFRLADGAPRDEAWLLACWNLDDFKRSQDQDRREGDWTLPAPPSVSFPDEAAARREFHAAMEAWDSERADRAVTGLLPFHDRESFFDVIRPYAARSYVNIGHKIIYAVQIDRVLGRIGWHEAQPAVRSLVYGLLHTDPGRMTDTWDRAVEIAPRIPETWLDGRESPARSAEVLAVLKGATPEGAQDAVVIALKEGLGPATIWDGIRLCASEFFLARARSRPARHRGALLPVHAVTEMQAMGAAWRAERDGMTKRCILLQAAAWLPMLRDDLKRRDCLAPEGADLMKLAHAPGEEPPGLEQATDPATALAFLDQGERNAGAWIARRRALLARRGVEHHQHKYAAAMVEEAALAHPRWASRLLAPAVPYLPTPDDEETEVARRARAALRSAGVG